MRAILWRGGAEDVLAWQRAPVSRARIVADRVPDFVLEAQLAALRIAPAASDDIITMAPAATRDDIIAARLRAFVVEAPDAERCGRFVEDVADLSRCATLAIDGPMFARRVDVVAGDVVRGPSGWRLTVGIRGC